MAAPGPGVCGMCQERPRQKNDGKCRECRAAYQKERRRAASEAIEKLKESQERVRELETAVRILRKQIDVLSRLTRH